MTPQDARNRDPIFTERLAEAAVWIARLHGDDRCPAMEAGCRLWLQAHPVNARAFEVVTEAWEDARNLPRIKTTSVHPMRRVRWRRGLVAAALASLALFIVLSYVSRVWQLRANEEVSTGVGEQRVLALQDGSRIFLNTATTVAVHYDSRARRVQLLRGEALFNVAKGPLWPFIVTAGRDQVRALGTSFVVRKDDGRVAVTLLEGKVTVSAAGSALGRDDLGSAARRAAHSSYPKTPNQLFTLLPGERLVFLAGKAAAIDTPRLAAITAWRRGEVMLDDTPLSGAVAEMNRYSTLKLTIEQPAARALRVDGLFHVGDSLSFANAVANTYGMHVVIQGEKIVLAGAPRGATRTGDPSTQ